MGDFVDGASDRPALPIGSSYLFDGERTLQNILCSSNQNVWCSFMPLNGDEECSSKASL